MDEQKAWIRSRRKRRLRITAVILSLCLLFTTYPNILEAISVFAAEEAAPEAGDDNEEATAEDGAGSAGQEDMEESDIGEADTVTEDEEEQDAQPEESEEEAVGTEETDETDEIVQENGEDAAVQALLERIAALPDVQEYMEKEPDIDNWEGDDDAYEEAYAEWMEGLSAYAEKVLAIWEEYEALTQEQQARIPEEALHKLTAWMEIAEQAAGSRNVMAAADGDLKNHSTNHSGWTGLGSSTSLSRDGNYYLTADRNTLTIPSGVTVNLCLNGYKINKSSSGNVITVESGATLNLYDCQGSGTVSSTYNNGGGMVFSLPVPAQLSIYTAAPSVL